MGIENTSPNIENAKNYLEKKGFLKNVSKKDAEGMIARYVSMQNRVWEDNLKEAEEDLRSRGLLDDNTPNSRDVIFNYAKMIEERRADEKKQNLRDSLEREAL